MRALLGPKKQRIPCTRIARLLHRREPVACLQSTWRGHTSHTVPGKASGPAALQWSAAAPPPVADEESATGGARLAHHAEPPLTGQREPSRGRSSGRAPPRPTTPQGLHNGSRSAVATLLSLPGQPLRGQKCLARKRAAADSPFALQRSQATSSSRGRLERQLGTNTRAVRSCGGALLSSTKKLEREHRMLSMPGRRLKPLRARGATWRERRRNLTAPRPREASSA